MSIGTFTWSANYGAAAQRKPIVKSIKYGDGYEQRLPAGINTRPEMWDLQFTNRDTTEANAIDNFLASANGVFNFVWTTPTGVTGNFICREWSRNISYGNVYTIAAKFEQVFES